MEYGWNFTIFGQYMMVKRGLEKNNFQLQICTVDFGADILQKKNLWHHTSYNSFYKWTKISSLEISPFC